MAKIVIHKADQPDSVVDFLDAHSLVGKRFAEVDLFPIQAQAAATGGHHGSVVEGVVRLGDAVILGGNIHLRKTLHREWDGGLTSPPLRFDNHS